MYNFTSIIHKHEQSTRYAFDSPSKFLHNLLSSETVIITAAINAEDFNDLNNYALL